MRLDKLIKALDEGGVDYRFHLPPGISAAEIEVSDMVCDDGKVCRGAIFAATKGDRRDAHDFISQAVAAGSPVVLCEREVEERVPQIISPNVRAAMGRVASFLYGEPAKKMTMIALTGTNGKTTSTFMTQAILNAAGIKSGLMGTVQNDDGKSVDEAEHTTPEGCDIQRLLSRMAANGCKACAMEASSHSIEPGRINGLGFDRAGFTNLTWEHLDYHGDMEHYFLAKKKLFDKYMRNDWKACVNIDDEYGRRLFHALGERAISYSVRDERADFFASVKGVTEKGLAIEVKTPESRGGDEARLPLFGDHNVSNALQALSIAWSLGVSYRDSLAVLETIPNVSGRLDLYRLDNGASCVIDFAHTPDGIEKALSALRPICAGKLVIVFGSGGENDKSKRPAMGEAAARGADFVILTTDDPRGEDPASIMAEIEPGVKRHGTPYAMIVDRRAAVYEGLDRAGSGDVIVIAGRGPETRQLLKEGAVPLVDREIMTDWCALRGRKVL